MDDNQNNNLFDLGGPPQQPPEPGSQEPLTPSEGAQVYNAPSEPSGYQPVEPPPPPYTPPPPPPPMGTATPQGPRRNTTVWIIVAVVVVLLLCCCCLGLAGIWLYNNGDQLMQDFNSFLPNVIQALV